MLQLKDVRKCFGKRLVLDDLHLRIEPGEIYGLLGPNGAGKTTTINLICNLMTPDSGFISFNDLPINKIDKRWLGIAPQENLLYKSLSCRENLNFFARIYGLGARERKERVRRSLAAVNLWERADSPIDTLSGGMQRRMNIATAIVHQPKLLILDEPTTGLDIETRYEIWKLIGDLSQQGMTILLTTHLLDEAQYLCHRIGIIKAGKIIKEGSLSQLRQLIPAKEIIVIETGEPEAAIARGQSLGFTAKYYGQNLAFWLPRTYELNEIIGCFDGVDISSIARQSVQLEHIYLEVMNLD